MKPRLHIVSTALLLTLLAQGPARAEVTIGHVTVAVTTTDGGLLSPGALRALVDSVLAALGAR